jgi:hypothetical protein
MITPIAPKLTLALAALAACATLVGCASGPTFAEYRSTLPPCPKGEARVWFYRPAWVGAAVQPNVNLDGAPVGKAVPKGFFHADTTPGVHQVSITTEWTHKRPITVPPNTDSFIRLNLFPGLFVAHIVPEQVPPPQALSEIQDLHLAQ